MKYLSRGATLLLVLAASFPLLADGAKGSFRFGKVHFEPVDALAFQVPGKDAKPVTLVALTNFKIDRPAVMEAVDTYGALAVQSFNADKGSFVIVRLNTPTQCGLGGVLDQGAKQTDLGDSFTAKTTSMTATRVAGSCATDKPGKMFDDAYEFKFSYDLPITAIPKPIELPAGGGEPGATYTTLVKAIQTANWDAAHLHLAEESVPATKPKASEMKEYFRGIGLNYPKTVKVIGGLMKPTRANLNIQGTDRDDKKINGVVAMKKVDGQWRVIDQSFYFAQ